MGITPITATVNGGTNSTMCQIEIENLMVDLTMPTTTQTHGLDPWDLTGASKTANFLGQTGEQLTLNISTETGRPINYRIYWIGCSTEDFNATLTNIYQITHIYSTVIIFLNFLIWLKLN